MTTTDQLDKVLGYLYQEKPKKKTYGEILRTTFDNDKNVSIQNIMNHLGRDHFVELNLRITTRPTITGETIDEFSISIKGIDFYEKAKISERPYLSKEKSEKTAKREKGFDKIVRWVFPAIAILISVATLLINKSSQQDSSAKIESLQRQINVLRDSLKIKSTISPTIPKKDPG